MTLIQLNEGESVTIQMNHDIHEKPKRYSILIQRSLNCLMVREFNPENNDFMPNSNNKGCGKREYIKTEKGGTWAVCGCPNGWLCSECSEKGKEQ